MEEIIRAKKVAEKAARDAGKYILEHMGRLKEVSHKSGRSDLVTDVDRNSEKMIMERVKKEFPSHAILAEESGGAIIEGAVNWIIDPLDGTTNYTHCFPFFCVSIGIFFEGSVKASIVYDPSRDELFSAEEGKGAFLNGKNIRVSEQDAVGDSLIATGFAPGTLGKRENLKYFGKMIESAQAVRRAGSAALDLCYVACGRFEGFWELGLNPWDTAAGQLLVKEAGGTVTAISCEPFDLFKKEILATNGRIHDEMLRLMK